MGLKTTMLHLKFEERRKSVVLWFQRKEEYLKLLLVFLFALKQGSGYDKNVHILSPFRKKKKKFPLKQELGNQRQLPQLLSS